MNLNILIILIAVSSSQKLYANDLVNFVRKTTDLTVDIITLGEHGRQREREAKEEEQRRIQAQAIAKKEEINREIKLSKEKNQMLFKQQSVLKETLAQFEKTTSVLLCLDTLMIHLGDFSDKYEKTMTDLANHNSNLIEHLNYTWDLYSANYKLLSLRSGLTLDHLSAVSQDPLIRQIIEKAKDDAEQAGRVLSLLIVSSLDDSSNPRAQFVKKMQEIHDGIKESSFEVKATLENLKNEITSNDIKIKAEEIRITELERQL